MHTRDDVALHDRADVAGAETVLGDVAGQNHVAVHVEGHGLPRVHGNESGHVGSSVDLPDRAEPDGSAAGRRDRPLDFVNDAVRVGRRVRHIERQVLDSDDEIDTLFQGL